MFFKIRFSQSSCVFMILRTVGIATDGIADFIFLDKRVRWIGKALGRTRFEAFGNTLLLRLSALRFSSLKHDKQKIVMIQCSSVRTLLSIHRKWPRAIITVSLGSK